jgi:DNA polymerase-3 subunit delta'
VSAAVGPALSRLAEEGRLPSVLLLTGAREAPLEVEARRLACRLLCPGGDPGATCESCRRVGAGLHPDLFLVAPEGVAIRIDRVREALQFAAGRPYEAPRRVAIVTRADRLGLEAANALLKALEEPGSKLHWILTTTSAEALLPTIRSRCTLARLRTPPAGSARTGAGPDEDARDLELLAGGPDAPEGFDLEAARELRARTVEALEAGLRRGDLPALLCLADELARRERQGARLLAELLADAALLALPEGGEFARHRAVAGRLSSVVRGVAPDLLRAAALRAADAPPDNRRGNRRMHFESVLLNLWERRVNREP